MWRLRSGTSDYAATSKGADKGHFDEEGEDRDVVEMRTDRKVRRERVEGAIIVLTSTARSGIWFQNIRPTLELA